MHCLACICETNWPVSICQTYKSRRSPHTPRLRSLDRRNCVDFCAPIWMFFVPFGRRTFCWLPSLVDTTVNPVEVVQTRKPCPQIILSISTSSYWLTETSKTWSQIRLSMRTGSNWLTLLVNSHPRLVSVYWQRLYLGRSCNIKS